MWWRLRRLLMWLGDWLWRLVDSENERGCMERSNRIKMDARWTISDLAQDRNTMVHGPILQFNES